MINWSMTIVAIYQCIIMMVDSYQYNGILQ